MKNFLLLAFSFITLQTFAQDVIYLKDGSKIPGKISEISKESVKFRNLANPNGPSYTLNINDLEFAFNASGNYLVFDSSKTISDQEKDLFINQPAKLRQYDIIV